jgi:hypothetical protein
MRWQLRRLAGSSSGASGSADGSFDEARFSSPLDLALSPDEQSLYVADAYNGIRQILLDNDAVATWYQLNNIPRWDAAGTLSGRCRNLSLGSDGVMRVTADNLQAGQPGVIFELSTNTGVATCALSTAGTVGAIAHDPGGTTATVRTHINEVDTGWGTLQLAGINRGQITEPPELPDPPFCDPPTNSVPVQVVNVRDNDASENAGVARVGSVIVAFRWGPGSTNVAAFDPWNETSFPSPYTTCDTPSDPAAVVVNCVGATATPRPPWTATRGPDDPLTGLPTVIGAPWRSPNGFLLRAVLDADNGTLQVGYDLVPGFADLPVMSVAYSPSRETFYFTTAAVWGNPGTNVPPNQILALELVPDLPFYTGGSGRFPIGGT